MNMKLGNALLITSIAFMLSFTGYAMGDFLGSSGQSYNFNGNNIKFSFDADDWQIEGVEAYNITMIDKLCVPSSSEFFGGLHIPGEFKLETKEYEISVGNFSEPTISYKALEKSSLKMYLDDGVEIEKEVDMNENSGLSFKKSGVNMVLITDGVTKTYEKTISVSLDKGETLIIRFYRGGVGAQETFKDAMVNAFKLHRIGAEVKVDVLRGNASFISYNNISIKPLEIEKSRISLKVKSNDTEGKCVVLDLPAISKNLSVYLDGKEIEKGSYYDALFSTGNESVWNMTFSDDGPKLLVYIPHFSEHTLTIEENNIEPAMPNCPPGHLSWVLPLLMAFIVSGIAAVVLFKKKR
jgi:hypothetical protein